MIDVIFLITVSIWIRTIAGVVIRDKTVYAQTTENYKEHDYAVENELKIERVTGSELGQIDAIATVGEFFVLLQIKLKILKKNERFIEKK